VSLRVLSVAYPFAPVTADPVGGAEQVLARLDRAVVQAGGASVVIASEGSTPAGELAAIPAVEGEIGADAKADTYRRLRGRIAEVAARFRPDVIHLHGIDFPDYLPPPGRTPILATLHLPLAWYPPEALRLARPDLWLVPVSQDQVRRGPPLARLSAPIENGVDVELFQPGRKRRFALALGRICPEKGFHLALDAARTADVALLLAGAVYPYADHQRYFAEEIAPRLDARRRWLGSVAGAPKRRLIAAARCLVVPSLVPETSSLVAREALAAGTPVAGAPKRRLIAAARCLVVPSLVPETSSLVAREALAAGTPVAALRNGALVDALEDGRTGVLVDDPRDLARAMREAASLDGAVCRRAALERFDGRRMAEAYLDVYRRLARGEGLDVLPVQAEAA
jgi:glycosyltransferase involved in cell wall biosynthesis